LNSLLAGSPFWVAFLFMAFVSMPMSYVILPIGAANLGIFPSIAMVLFVTIMMMVCTASIAEGIVNLPSGVSINGLGDLFSHYLGRRIGYVAVFAITALFFLIVIAASLSVVGTLAAYTNTSEYLWLSILGAIVIYVVLFGSIAYSLSLFIGLISFVFVSMIIISLSPFLEIERLDFIQLPFTNNRGLAPGLWSSFLGVILYSFIGPLLLVPSSAFAVRKKEDSNAYIKGSLSGILFQGFLMILYILFVELSEIPSHLVGLHGAIFMQLGQDTSSFVEIMGGVLVILLPGLALVRAAVQLKVQMNLLFNKFIGSESVSVILKRIIQISPTLFAFMIVVLMLEWHLADVSKFLSMAGVLGSSIAIGIIPLILYRKLQSEVILPGLNYLLFFRNKVVILFFTFFYSLMLVLYGLFIWDFFIIQLITFIIAVLNLFQAFYFISWKRAN
jgi:amino acid permease